MKIIQTKVYDFDELNDAAKEKAREWYRENPFDAEWAWENIQEDAKSIGLTILTLDDHRANKGEFLASAEETAHKIEKEHGDSCETYIDAKAYLLQRDAIVNQAERDENGDFAKEYELDNALDEIDQEFLSTLLEDYRIMLNKEIEYQYSNEYVDDNIRANEYTFTETGKREG